MAPPYCYDYPRPAVTVDLAAFGLAGGSLRVLLIRRKHDPFAGLWALPGGFLDLEEPIEAAARRELREETGLDLPGPVEPIGVFGDPGRDPRGRTISLAHGATVRGPLPAVRGGDDAEGAAWVAPDPRPALAFDHDAILATARAWLLLGVTERSLGLALLPSEFDDEDVRMLYRAIGAPASRAIAWRKRMGREGRVVPGSEGRFRSAGG